MAWDFDEGGKFGRGGNARGVKGSRLRQWYSSCVVTRLGELGWRHHRLALTEPGQDGFVVRGRRGLSCFGSGPTIRVGKVD